MATNSAGYLSLFCERRLCILEGLQAQKDSMFVQEFHADLVLADISYIAGLWVSEVLDLPNVKLSNLPIYEPYHAATIGFPTVLAYNPMDGHGLAPPMVGPSAFHCHADAHQ